MKNMMITNCPNCGGELTESGFCKYCKTHVRYENELNIGKNDVVEILIKHHSTDKDGNNCAIITPFRGYLVSFHEEIPILYADCLSDFNSHIIRGNRVEVELTFHVTIGDVRREV